MRGRLPPVLRERDYSLLLGLERVLTGIDGLAFVHLSSQDVVRHRIVADIVAAYERNHETGPGRRQ